VIADPDRRFRACVVDRGLALVAYAATAAVAYVVFIEPGHRLAGLVVVAAVTLGVWSVGVLLTGLGGVTPGKALCRLRVVGVTTGVPVGLKAACLRQLIVGLGSYPTLGMGDVALAWTATADGSGLRRGWHDRLAGTVVLDVRPRPAEAIVEPPAPGGLVNLTALRLLPAEPMSPPVAAQGAAQGAAPARASAPAPAAARPHASPAAARPRWRVTFDTGQTLLVEGLALLGRNPQPGPGERPAHVVPLPSADLSLSKTHAQLGVVPDGALVVMDRGSANGSTLLRGSAAKPLAPRRPATLLAGDRVRFGDREMTVDREP
jgi:uncharacterized RDD family membrane protein YckC